MAFKVDKPNFDWDLEVPLIPDEQGVIKYELVKCVISMNGDNYANFLNHLNSLVPNDEKDLENAQESMRKDASKSIGLVIEQIDYLYHKGVEWWKNNVAPDTIIRVQRHLLSFTDTIAQKKSS